MNTTNNNLPQEILEVLGKAEELKDRAQHEESIKLLQQLLLDFPDCCEAYEEIGDNYMSLREIKKAEKALQHAMKLNPKSANGHYLLGFLFSLQHKWTSSVEELRQADDLFPNHPEILRCLGWAIYNCNRQTQGIAVLERSKTLSPNDVNIICDLGVCYMNSQKIEEARKAFGKVMELAPDSEQAQECKVFLQMLEQRNV